jgi:hypothetical protein
MEAEQRLKNVWSLLLLIWIIIIYNIIYIIFIIINYNFIIILLIIKIIKFFKDFS